MNAVETVTLAHVRFLAHTAENAINKNGGAGETTIFDGLLSLINSFSKGETGDDQEYLLGNLPFFLGQTPLTPYILIAATTDGARLAEYIKRPDGPELKKAVEDASANCLVMDVPELTELVLDFFGKFSPWSKGTLAYLDRAGWTKKKKA
jgi:hypothetical protein